ncbi:hypothetical protein [Chryseobacterium sp. M5A1_1a]
MNTKSHTIPITKKLRFRIITALIITNVLMGQTIINSNTALFSTKAEQNHKKISLESVQYNDDDFGTGCFTEYALRKGKNPIYVQGADPTSNQEIAYMEIDNSKEKFIVNDHDVTMNRQGNILSSKVENSRYKIKIIYGKSESFINCDCSSVKGKLIIIKKKSGQTNTFLFEGGTTC